MRSFHLVVTLVPPWFIAGVIGAGIMNSPVILRPRKARNGTKNIQFQIGTISNRYVNHNAFILYIAVIQSSADCSNIDVSIIM